MRQIVYETEKLEAKNEECKVLHDINSSVRTELDQCAPKASSFGQNTQRIFEFIKEKHFHE